MSNKTSGKINFQRYVDAVKQKEMTWNIFQGLVEDFSHSDVYRLKILNAILLTELTIDYSDLDRLKYLNIILLSEFKNYIQRIDLNINNTQISKSKISTNTQIMFTFQN